MTMLLKVVILVILCFIGSATARDYPRQRILQEQSCYYEPYKKQLTCQCDINLTKAFLLLKLSYNILDIGQEVRSVQIVSCPDLLLSLDLLRVNPTHIPITVRNCGVVTVDMIETEPPGLVASNQLVNFSFNNVETVHFQRINITQGFKVNTVNVKNLLVTESEIGVLPPDGLLVSNTKKLSIKDSKFNTAYPRSIKVSGVKEVFITNNQFSINVIKVVSAEDGKRLHISCNRLLGEPISPECIIKPDTTTPVSSYHSIYYSSSIPTTTAGNTTELTPSSTTQESTTSLLPADLIMDVGLSYEILIGIAAGVCLIFLILLALVVWLCCRTRKAKSNESSCCESPIDKASTDTNENLNNHGRGESTAELDKLLNNQQDSDIRSDSEEVSPIPSPRNKFASPVWIQEIHNNKIFAKQRSINSPEGKETKEEDAPLMNGNHYTNDSTPRRGPVKIPVRSISEILEYETLEDIDAEAKKQEEQAENINNEQKSADNKIIETVVEETAVPTENSDAINGEVISNGGKIIANGGQNGDAKHLLQTDI